MMYHAQDDFVNLDSARQSSIGPQEEHHSQMGKGDEKGRFCKVAASPNSHNLTERGMELPKVQSSRILHHNDFFSLREDLLEKNGTLHPYTALVCTDAVAILAHDEQGRWILNREYRHPTGQVLLGCPGGCLEKGEDPIAGGKREFLEETGYSFDGGILMGCCHSFPGFCNQRIYYLFGKNAAKQGGQKLDPLECIEPILLDEEALFRLIQEGTPIDGILLSALWFKDHL